MSVLDTTLCDKVWQWLAAGRWVSPGTPVSSTDITEILLKVASNTINLNQNSPADIHDIDQTWAIQLTPPALQPQGIEIGPSLAFC